MKLEIIIRRLSLLILTVGPAVSLAVSPAWNYDPINLVKILCLSTFSFGIFGIVMSDFSLIKNRLPNIFWFICLFFALALVNPLLLSGAPLNQQFWGAFGRNTGFLTYISLLFILIGTAIVKKFSFYKAVVHSLIWTSVPVTFYSLIQIAGMDPVAWSAKFTFATFGNVNFLSAFMGMSTLASLILILDKNLGFSRKILLGILSAIDILIITSTDSIQGVMILIAGIGIAVYLYVINSNKLSRFKVPYLILAITGFILTVFGIGNKGPLARFIFQDSIIFRSDYMHAGWAMTLNRPFFGVGLDSYGDWYRQVRGSISANRTGPDRTANTAHNIFLDLSSSGGFPLLFGYLALVGFAVALSVKWLRSNKVFDAYFTSIFSCWVAYQIQALVSINQIGVGIWGWILNGALIGICLTDIEGNNRFRNQDRIKKIKGLGLAPKTGIYAILFSLLGFTLAFLPFNADSKYRTAFLSRDLNKMILAVHSLGSTSWHLSELVSAAYTNNLTQQAKVLDLELRTKYPHDFFGWKILYFLSTSTEAEKSLALNKMYELDPFNSENPPKS